MPFINTISAAWAAFLAHMQELENTSGSGSSLVIRKVAEGEASYDDHAVPFIVLQLLDAEVEQRTDQNKRWQQRLKIRIVSEAQSADGAIVEILSKIAQVEDKIETFTKPDGVTGFEDAKSSITYPQGAQHGDLIVAESIRNFSVVVQRGANE